ncbi:MAG TPA: hypothetical protein VF706_06685 [Solirubrobacteraceae bacterium]
MVSMRRGARQKVVAGAAVAVLLAGGAIAAVSATGQSNDAKRSGGHGVAGRARARELATAASYLGVSSAQLSGELRSGRSLAQIAEAAGGGKSAKGLVEALESAGKAKLAAAAGSLSARVAAEVNRPGGPLGGRASGDARLNALFSARRRLGQAAAAYLGTTPAELKRELRSGKTLAQIAGASAGLIDALAAAAEQRAPAARAARASVSAAQRAKREQRLKRRATHLVQRKFAGAGSP